jgi:glycosyltransferase involved in cell wall biosynthesis
MVKDSIIIPCYNQCEYVEEAGDLSLAQTFWDFEINSVKNGSTDRFTIGELKNYNKPKNQEVQTNSQELYASIIITCYKEGILLLNAIKSLEKQTSKNFETIIINDNSQDNETNSICRKLESDGFFVIWHSTNTGLSGSRNTGFLHSRNEIIIPLDADDTLPEDAVEIILSTFQKYPKADFVFGDYRIKYAESFEEEIRSCKKLTDENNLLNPKTLSFPEWTLLGTSPCKKQLWKKLNGYNLVFTNTCQDVDFWMRATVEGACGVYTGKIIYNWHLSKSGMNHSVNIEELNIMKLFNYSFFLKFSENPSLEIENIVQTLYEELRYFQTENKHLMNLNYSLINSKTYKLGKSLIRPFSLWKRLLKLL